MPWFTPRFQLWKQYFGWQNYELIDISQLPQHIQERIVTKFEWQSYFRLQQTCKAMEEFIRTNRNIRICLPADYDLYIKAAHPPRCSVSSIDRTKKVPRPKTRNAHPDTLFGLRFGRIWMDKEFETVDKEFKILKMYRITSAAVDEAFYSKVAQLSNNEYENLLKILKPVEVHLNSEGSNRWEVLLKAKQLKDIWLTVQLEDISHPGTMEAFLEKCSQLYINAHGEKMSSHLPVVNVVLEYLCSQPHLNLRSFTYKAWHNDPGIPSTEVLLEPFHNFNPVRLEREEDNSDYIFECRIGLDDRLCMLRFGLRRMEIRCQYVGKPFITKK